MDATIDPWWWGELAECIFVDGRLGQRLRKLIERMAGAIGASLPLACQDWANTKAAYRFFSNDRVSKAQILPATSTRRASASPRQTARLSSPSSANAPRP